MRRNNFVALLIVAAFALALTATAAFADTTPNFHNSPTCTVSGSGTSKTATCTGTLYGVGNRQLQADTIVSGFATYTCVNKGGNTAPGQNQVTAGPSQSVPVGVSSQDKNGAATFTTNANTLTAPATISGNLAGCPNGNWTGVTPQVTITSIELRIYQGNTSFYDCTVSDPNGLSGTITFPTSC
jgi:hypothetical protein